MIFFKNQKDILANNKLFHNYELTIREGEELKKNGNFEEALKKFLLSLDFSKRINYKLGHVDSLICLGILYWNVGNFKESSIRFNEALQIAQELNLRERCQKCRNALDILENYKKGKKFRYSGEYQESIDSFISAIRLARLSGSKDHELICLIQLGKTYWQLNRFEDYFSLNLKALTIAQSLNHKKYEGVCLYNIGVYYLILDDYSKSLSFFESALKIAQLLENKENESDCLVNIGVIFEKIGKYDRALEHLTNALSIDQYLGKRMNIMTDLNNIGTTYRARGLSSSHQKDFYKALEYFKSCLQLTRKKSLSPRKEEEHISQKTEIQALNNIGTVLIDLRTYNCAFKYLHMGYQKALEIRELEVTGMILVNMGIVRFNQGAYEEAIKLFEKSIQLANENNRQILWEAYFGLGQCFEKMRRLSDAAEFYKKAINIIDHIRSQILFDTYKASFSRDKIKIYEYLINLLFKMSLNDPLDRYKKDVFHIVERAKARAFLECLGLSNIDIKKKLEPEFIKEDSEISKRISLIMQELSNPTLTKERRNDLFFDLHKEENRYINLISKIKMWTPEVANLLLPEPCNVGEIQALLNKKTVLIEYFLGENQSYMFLIKKDKFLIYTLPPRHRIVTSLKAYLKIISDPPAGEFKGILAANRIYKEIFHPIEEEIDGIIENLIIIPDGILYYLPFETLIRSSSNKKSSSDYLIKYYKISYAPSSSGFLFLLKQRLDNKVKKDFLAFGNPSYSLNSLLKDRKINKEILKDMYLDVGFNFFPIPYSEREVLKISRYFPKEKVDVYLNHNAKEEIIKKTSLTDYKIIHFACHGFLDEKYPIRSALILSLEKDSVEDGFLQVREIYSLKLNADLVVLSACQTGKGRLERGEGILGFPRIFFYVGAKSIVLSLWRINDKSTSLFMDIFYYYLTKGYDKAQALRLAKLKMMKTKYCHPYYWAAFILNGEFNSKIF